MMWFNCPSFKKKFGDDVVQFQVNHLVCFSCNYICPIKEVLIDRFLHKIEEIENLQDKLRRSTSYNCPLNLRKECSAHKAYCEYTPSCPNLRRHRNTKMLRYRRMNMYLVSFKDKTTRLIARDDKAQLSELASTIIKALKIDYLLEITTELLPNTDDGKARKDNVDEFVERFGQSVLTLSGKEVKLKDWFNSAKDGEQCYVATEELLPVKKIKAISAKNLEVPKESDKIVAVPPRPLQKKISVGAKANVRKMGSTKRGNMPLLPKPVMEKKAEVTQAPSQETTTDSGKKRVRRTRAQLIADGYYDESGKKR